MNRNHLKICKTLIIYVTFISAMCGISLNYYAMRHRNCWIMRRAYAIVLHCLICINYLRTSVFETYLLLFHLSFMFLENLQNSIAIFYFFSGCNESFCDNVTYLFSCLLIFNLVLASFNLLFL